MVRGGTGRAGLAAGCAGREGWWVGECRGGRMGDGGGDDNISRPVACQSGKISVFLGYIFIFKEKTHSVNCMGF